MFETKKDNYIYTLMIVLVTITCLVLYSLSYENGEI